MRVNPMTSEQRERFLSYQREYSKTRRLEKKQSETDKKIEARRRIAAAIILAEMAQESNG
jgi:hypothetical protein